MENEMEALKMRINNLEEIYKLKVSSGLLSPWSSLYEVIEEHKWQLLKLEAKEKMSALSEEERIEIMESLSKEE